MDRILDLQALLPETDVTAAGGSGISLCCAGCASAISNGCKVTNFAPDAPVY